MAKRKSSSRRTRKSSSRRTRKFGKKGGGILSGIIGFGLGAGAGAGGYYIYDTKIKGKLASQTAQPEQTGGRRKRRLSSRKRRG